MLRAQWHKGSKAPRRKGTKAQRLKGTKAQRHKGTKAQRHKGMTKNKRTSLFRRLLSDTPLTTHLKRNLGQESEPVSKLISAIFRSEDGLLNLNIFALKECNILTFSHFVSPTNLPGVCSTYLWTWVDKVPVWMRRHNVQLKVSQET